MVIGFKCSSDMPIIWSRYVGIFLIIIDQEETRPTGGTEECSGSGSIIITQFGASLLSHLDTWP